MKTIIKINGIKQFEAIGKDGTPFTSLRLYADNCIINVSQRCEDYQALENVAKGDEVLVDYYETLKDGSAYKNARSIKLLDKLTENDIIHAKLDIIEEKLDSIVRQLGTSRPASSFQGTLGHQVADKVDEIVNKFQKASERTEQDHA